MVPDIFVGTSGFSYDHWRYRFYTQGLARGKWLQFYAIHFNTVELNNTFYRLPSGDNFAAWYESSPANFTFAVKASRFITHVRRLKNSQEAVKLFLGRARLLGEKLGPVLYQLPPNMYRDDERLASFLSILPAGVRHVFEFRHSSWIEEAVLQILRDHNIGFCVFDMPEITCPLVATADFAYIRFHGSTGLYSSCYHDEELAGWAEKLAKLADGLKAVYIYFNNDAEAFAVRNAVTLRSYLQTAAEN